MTSYKSGRNRAFMKPPAYVVLAATDDEIDCSCAQSEAMTLAAQLNDGRVRVRVVTPAMGLVKIIRKEKDVNANEQNLKVLQQIVKALHFLDEDLRSKSKCPICGKPSAGIVPNGKTPEEIGLCTGHRKEHENESG